MTTDLKDLKELAEAAADVSIVETDTGGAFRTQMDGDIWGRFVSAASPETVLELISALESKTAKADVCHGTLLKITDERDALAQALRPFAKLAAYWLERASIHGLEDEDTCATEIEFGHLRNAVTAMGGDDGGS